MEKFKKLGFSEHCELSLYRTGVLYEVHIDAYSDSEYNLYSRIIENDVVYVKSDNRFVLFNKNNETLLDIDWTAMKDIMAKTYSDKCIDIIFSINGIRYKMFICGAETKERICAQPHTGESIWTM